MFCQVLNGTDYEAGDEQSYPYVCGNNGLVGEVLYDSPDPEYSPYLFTTTDAGTYAVNQSIAHCNALYAPICDSVGNLPPYSCARTIKPGFLTCASSALANAQFLVQVLVFISALVLPLLVSMYPVGGRVDRGNTPAETATAGHEAASASKHTDIEMTVHSQQGNPLSDC